MNSSTTQQHSRLSKYLLWIALAVVTLPNVAASVMTLLQSEEVIANYVRWGYRPLWWPWLAIGYSVGAALLWFRSIKVNLAGAGILSVIYLDNARHHLQDGNIPHALFALFTISCAWFIVWIKTKR